MVFLWTGASVLAAAGLANDLRGNQSSYTAYQLLASYVLLVPLLQTLSRAASKGIGPHYQESPSWNKAKTTDTTPFISTLINLFLHSYYALLDAFLAPSIRALPGPPVTTNFPLLGQARNVITASTPTAQYVKWSREFPEEPLIRFRTGLDTTILLVNSTGAARDLFSGRMCYKFRKPAWFSRLIGEVAGVGLLFAEGDAHKYQRKLLTPCFSPPNLRKLLPVFRAKAAELADFADRQLGDKEEGVLEGTYIPTNSMSKIF